VGLAGLGLELGGGTGSQEPGVIGDLHDLDEVLVGRGPRDAEALFRECLPEVVVELVAVAVRSSISRCSSIEAEGLAVQDAGVGAQAHGGALVRDVPLLG